MNKYELTTAIAEDHDLTVAESDRIVNNVLDRITSSLVANEKVTFTGFGTFSSVTRAARKGRNPATGEAIDIPSKKAAKFKAGSKLVAALK